MIVLGIDPALIKTGWGVVTELGGNLSFVACGMILVDPKLPISLRLKNIFNEVDGVIKRYNPDHLSIEETFVNMNPASSLKLGEARGAAILCGSMNNLPVFEYKPNSIKKSVTGAGKATKEQVGLMVKRLLPLSNAKTEDEADALAAAICHINSFRAW
ncbi:MAG: crossover junction endodeoxyribonuclease RuvC [Rickettsiales bacterium]|nr:crossover junction endodeoxyribonuclease RuvC [Rickettsiales bacterium]